MVLGLKEKTKRKDSVIRAGKTWRLQPQNSLAHTWRWEIVPALCVGKYLQPTGSAEQDAWQRASQVPELCQLGMERGSLQSPGIRGRGKRLKRQMRR